MIIRRMNIRNFGKINQKTFELSPGINVLYGENESGKTTFHTFVRSMFYGISRQRGRAAKNDPYKSYEPWNNPADYGGTLWFSHKGEDFRLTRNFAKEHEYHELVSETTGAITDASLGSLETVLSPVSEAVYDNTVSVGQLKSVTGQDLVRELQNYMASYEGTGDSSIDLARAVQLLKMTRKGYQSQEDKRQKELQKQQEQILGDMRFLKKDLDALQVKKDSSQKQRKALRIDEGGEEILEKRIQAARSRRTGNLLLSLLLFAVLIAAALFLPELFGGMLFVRIFLGILGAAVLLFGAARHRKLTYSIRKHERTMAKWKERQEKVLWDQQETGEVFGEKARTFMNLKADYLECEAQRKLRTEEQVEIEALTLALDTIEELSGNMVSQVGLRLRKRTSQILSEITGGRYSEVLMDEKLHMSVNTEERVVPLERLSRGTLEQIYFSLRMAAGELLCGEDPFPVILDDVFGMYDEERLAGVLSWLYENGRQVIISTCAKREMEILDQEGIPYQRLIL